MSGHTRQKVADVIAKAKERFDVVITTECTLLLDIDTTSQLKQCERMMDKFESGFGLKEVDRWKSKSGGTHIVVECDVPMEPKMRIAMQACLGSDPVREMLGLRHIENEVAEFSFLFRPRIEVAA